MGIKIISIMIFFIALCLPMLFDGFYAQSELRRCEQIITRNKKCRITAEIIPDEGQHP
jgi:hypothetical protein